MTVQVLAVVRRAVVNISKTFFDFLGIPSVVLYLKKTLFCNLIIFTIHINGIALMFALQKILQKLLYELFLSNCVLSHKNDITTN